MKNNNFWNDAARYGTLIGSAAILFSLIGTWNSSALLSVAWLSVFVVLLFYITRRRVALHATPEEGYGYGRCLGYILAMMLFSGFMEGVYTWLSANWLFPELYAEQMGRSIAMLENSGFYSSAQVEMAISMMRSPIVLIFAGIFAAVLRGLIFGLVVAAFTQRVPNIFETQSNDENKDE